MKLIRQSLKKKLNKFKIQYNEVEGQREGKRKALKQSTVAKYVAFHCLQGGDATQKSMNFKRKQKNTK